MKKLNLTDLWNGALATGINEHTPAQEQKFIRFTNLIALLTAVAVGAYIPHSLVIGAYALALLQLVDVFCVLLVFWLNKKQAYCMAKFTYLLVINSFVLVNACFIGYHSGVHEFLFISNIVPFLIYRVNDYKGIVSGIALSLFTFVAFHFVYPYFTAYNMSMEEQLSIYRINIVMKFILFGVAMYLLAAHNYKKETELAETNQKLTAFAAELQQSNRDLEQFAYIISHDLKAPVRNIAGFLKLYMKRYSAEGDEGRDLLQSSEQSAMRLAGLIDDILAYSKLGRNLPQADKADLQQLTTLLRVELTQKLEEHKATFEVADKLPVLAGVHPSMIYLVFQNLVANGIKFNTHAQPKVVINCTDEGEVYRFKVHDNGIGIPAHQRDKLFQMFRRLHTTEFEGTGMGLATCKKIVELYGGKIWIDPATAQGTCFVFTLPKNAKEGPAPATTAAEPRIEAYASLEVAV